jgi:hypothetical protein
MNHLKILIKFMSLLIATIEICLFSFIMSAICVMISLGMISRTHVVVYFFLIDPFDMKLIELVISFSNLSLVSTLCRI